MRCYTHTISDYRDSYLPELLDDIQRAATYNRIEADAPFQCIYHEMPIRRYPRPLPPASRLSPAYTDLACAFSHAPRACFLVRPS